LRRQGLAWNAPASALFRRLREAPGSQVGQLGVLARSYWLFQEGEVAVKGPKINDLRN